MRAALRGMKNVVYQYNDTELMVRAATNNDKYMVSNTQLANLARATNDYHAYPSLFAMLWKRLTDLEHVMHVQKALHVIEYLLRHANERFINDAKRRARDIACLQKFKHYDANNQDDARDARARAKQVYALLMDDQLLAQERGKSARLASEGRIGAVSNHSTGTYDDEYSPPQTQRHTQQQQQPAAVRRAPSTTTSAGQSSRPSTNLNSSRQPSGALRRRSIDEDPFENPVIPQAVDATPRARKAAPKQQGSAKSATPQQQYEVDDPDDGETEEEKAKRIKKAKKEKKRAKEAAAAAAAAQAEEEEQQEEEQPQPKAKRRSGKSSLAPPAASSSAHDRNNSAGSVDLMDQYGQDSPANRKKKNGGEVDLLSGDHDGADEYHNGDEDFLNLFNNNVSLEDSHPGFFHSGNGNGHGAVGGNPFLSPGQTNVDGDDEVEGGNTGFPYHNGTGSGAGSSASSSTSATPRTSTSHRHSGGNGHHNGNGIMSPNTTGALVNLNDITAPRIEKRETVDSGVSMSMMRSIQPLGSPATGTNTRAQENSQKRSNVPLSAPLPQQMGGGYQLNGFMGHPSQFAPPMYQGGYPMHPGMHPGMQHPGMYMQPHPQNQQPMLALMPPGMQHPGAPAGGYPPSAQYPYAAHPSAATPSSSSSSSSSALPFAASAPGSTFTQLRQQQPKNNNGVPIFDVVEAQQKPVEPTNFTNNQSAQNNPRNSSNYQSYYGKPNNTQPKITF